MPASRVRCTRKRTVQTVEPETEGGLPPELTLNLDRLDDLVAAFEQHPDEIVQAHAFELLRCVDAVHRPGLRRIADLLRIAGLEHRAIEDPEVRLLFDLYDLGEGGEKARADDVLQSVRPYIESHGGRLEVVGAESGVVTIRLSGACHGCSGSAATLRHVVEQALREGLSDFARMEVVEAIPEPAAGFVPRGNLLLPRRPRLVWYDALRADAVPDGGTCAVVVAGERVLVTSLAGEMYAYRNACPGTPLPLDAAPITNGAIECPWHGCRFDVRGGRRLDADGPGLGVVPISVEGGMVRIGVLEGPAK